jgi:hypothetical protein
MTTRINCEGCGDPLPPRKRGPGRPRKRCEKCPPTRRTAQLVDLGTAVVSLRNYVSSARGDFDARGQALWDDYIELLPGRLHRELLVEACRMADRLDRMNLLMAGDAKALATLQMADIWEQLSGQSGTDGLDVEITLNITSVAAEARQSAGTLKSMITELRTAAKEAARNAPAAEPEDDAIDSLTNLAAERLSRRGGAG